MWRLGVVVVATVAGCKMFAAWPSAEVPVSVEVDTRDGRDGAPLVGYIDGTRYRWVPLDVSDGAATFLAFDGKYAVASVCAHDGVNLVEVQYLSTADTRSVRVHGCGSGDRAVVRGTVHGLAADLAARASLSRSARPVLAGGAFALVAPPGTGDLLVVEGEGDLHAWQTRRLAILRDVVIGDQTTLDVDLARGVEPVDVRIEIEGLTGDELADVRAELVTADGARVTISRHRGRAPHVVQLPPDDVMRPGDRIDVEAIAGAGGAFRRVRGTVGALRLGAPMRRLLGKTVESVAGQSLRVWWGRHRDARYYEIGAVQDDGVAFTAVTARITRAWFDEDADLVDWSFALDRPLARLDGWPRSAILARGLPTRLQVWAIESPLEADRDGPTWRGAVRYGEVVP